MRNIRNKKKLQKMFREIGLGTAKKRACFLEFTDKEKQGKDKEEQIFIRLDNETQVVQRRENA